MIFRVAGANQNAPKLLSTDLMENGVLGHHGEPALGIAAVEFNSACAPVPIRNLLLVVDIAMGDGLRNDDAILNLVEITSPRYPGHYPNDIECTWLITVPDGLKVKLKFKFFYMENGERCDNDYVEVRDGPSYDSLKLGRFCGVSKPETQLSSQSKMWIRFSANSYHNYNGFDASWSPTKDSLVTAAASKVNGVYEDGVDCSGYIRSNYGHLTSPGYPIAYQPNLNCEWIITVSKGRIIQFYFDDLDIEERDYCRHDYISLRDGPLRSSPSLGRYCGMRKPVRDPIQDFVQQTQNPTAHRRLDESTRIQFMVDKLLQIQSI
ncbi:hypothetical protein QZH41_004395 [Actinostola sp. cb2023]|nr:hypothetical protein QZH41_004395 [Actinostola sp. cb2023]